MPSAIPDIIDKIIDLIFIFLLSLTCISIDKLIVQLSNSAKSIKLTINTIAHQCIYGNRIEISY
jgi:hypothetical protein